MGPSAADFHCQGKSLTMIDPTEGEQDAVPNDKCELVRPIVGRDSSCTVDRDPADTMAAVSAFIVPNRAQHCPRLPARAGCVAAPLAQQRPLCVVPDSGFRASLSSLRMANSERRASHVVEAAAGEPGELLAGSSPFFHLKNSKRIHCWHQDAWNGRFCSCP